MNKHLFFFVLPLDFVGRRGGWTWEPNLKNEGSHYTYVNINLDNSSKKCFRSEMCV